MKRKIIAVCLALAMCLSFTACGDTGNQANNDSMLSADRQQQEDLSSQAPGDAEEAGPVENGYYDLNGINVLYYDSVRNDTTGNWRLGVIYDGSDLKSYVVDYYKFFCRDDSEIHGIVNLGLKTTAQISKITDDTLEITVTEYQDGEEHDANLLYSGPILERYWINTKTLEVDPLDDTE